MRQNELTERANSGQAMRDSAALDRRAAAAVETGGGDPLTLAAYRTALREADGDYRDAERAANVARTAAYVAAMSEHYGATAAPCHIRAAEFAARSITAYDDSKRS